MQLTVARRISEGSLSVWGVGLGDLTRLNAGCCGCLKCLKGNSRRVCVDTSEVAAGGGDGKRDR